MNTVMPRINPSTPVLEKKIIFWDFKGYWNDIINIVINEQIDNDIIRHDIIEVQTWENYDYSTYNSVFNESGELAGCFDSNKLHVFIAPITWSGLYTEHVKILGPAFATYGDIKLYNSVHRNGQINDKINIEVIDKYATSTIGLQIIMCGLCECTLNRDLLVFGSGIKQWRNRHQQLIDRAYSAAVFNATDLATMTQDKRNAINDIMDIDELYSLAKGIKNLPRVVYVLSKKQLNNREFDSIINPLIDSLKGITVDLPGVIENKHMLNPFCEINRKAIIDFLNDGKRFVSGIEYCKTETLKKNYYKS
jgi:hypothetical protein